MLAFCIGMAEPFIATRTPTSIGISDFCAGQRPSTHRNNGIGTERTIIPIITTTTVTRMAWLDARSSGRVKESKPSRSPWLCSP